MSGTQGHGELRELVDKASKGVANDSLDLSLNEIIGLHRSGDLMIRPEFQRLFRWSDEQQSRLIESVIIGLPIPQIFLFQNEDGVLELVDGLQRVSSIIRFIEPDLLAEAEHKTALKLSGCDIINELNGKTFEDLPVSLQREIRRKTVRGIIIRRINEPTIRYEMFRRLNSGGSPAESQEIRNATLRILGEPGEEFLEFVRVCSSNEHFMLVTETLPDALKEKQGRDELVLRWMSGVYFLNQFKGNVSDWIDEFIQSVLIDKSLTFNYDEARERFNHCFGEIAECIGEYAFVKYRKGQPMGALAPAYFEALSLAVAKEPKLLRNCTSSWSEVLAKAVESDDFRSVTGPGANSKPKLEKRITLIQEAFRSASNS